MLALRGRNAAILPSLSANCTSDGLGTRSARAHRANARAGPINPSADLAGRATRLGLEVIAKNSRQDFDQPGCQDGLRLTLTVARRHPMKLQALGVDLGKTVFHLVGLDSTGRVVIRKRCSRTQLLAFTANLQVQLIGMEACSGAHFLGRALREQGHEVRLMPAQYVKPYVQTNKSDYLDAEAIVEAVQRPRIGPWSSRYFPAIPSAIPAATGSLKSSC